MSDFFTSDTHFGHRNVIRYSHRPFCSKPTSHLPEQPCAFCDVEAMNRALIERWNARVRSGDTVYHLGDFAMGLPATFAKYARALNGYKILVLGNHDRGFTAMGEIGFDQVHRKLVINHAGCGVLLRHHPQDDLDTKGFSIQFCGHVHEKWATRRTPAGGLIVNVGVDQNDFRPITFEEAISRDKRPPAVTPRSGP